MLGFMAVSGVLADLINLPDIVGAFLAGLAVNAAVGDHPAKEKLDFFGRAFFIPIFFIVVGLLIVPSAVAQTIFNNFWLVAGLVASLVLGKGIAAAVTARAFGYARPARLTMWALTLPQVAATLAATLVGYNTLNAAGERLLTAEIFNAVLVLLVVTSVLSTIPTEVFARGMVKASATTDQSSSKLGQEFYRKWVIVLPPLSRSCISKSSVIPNHSTFKAAMLQKLGTWGCPPSL